MYRELRISNASALSALMVLLLLVTSRPTKICVGRWLELYTPWATMMCLRPPSAANPFSVTTPLPSLKASTEFTMSKYPYQWDEVTIESPLER